VLSRVLAERVCWFVVSRCEAVISILALGALALQRPGSDLDCRVVRSKHSRSQCATIDSGVDSPYLERRALCLGTCQGGF